LWDVSDIRNVEKVKNPFIISFANQHHMQILKLSTALPKDEYSTERLMELFQCELPKGVKQNILNLGVTKRHLISQTDWPKKTETVLSEASLVDLCSEACGKAIEKARLSVKDIDYFIAGYDANPFLCPGLSQLLIRRIGLSPYSRHINAQGTACTAFPIALELAENYLAGHPKDHVLVCISGVTSYWFHNQVRGIEDVMEIGQINRIKNRTKRQMELRKWVATIESFLFGDGVAAAIVANEGEGLAVRKIVEVTNVGSKDYLTGYARLSALDEPFRFGFYSHLGREIPELGAEYTDLALKRLLGKKADHIAKAAKKWAVHTGSEKILNRIAEHHGIRP
jgi:predicted naringenin-chalcone synthase